MEGLKGLKYEQEAKLSELCNRKGHSQNMCASLEALEDSWHAHKQITQSGFE
jgi:hypothetical protein